MGGYTQSLIQIKTQEDLESDGSGDDDHEDEELEDGEDGVLAAAEGEQEEEEAHAEAECIAHEQRDEDHRPARVSCESIHFHNVLLFCYFVILFYYLFIVLFGYVECDRRPP